MSIENSDPKNLPRPIPELTKSGEGDTSVIGIDDLVPREKRRLGDYAAYNTKGLFRNEYPVKEGSTGIRLTSPTGNPVSISDSASDSFADKTYLTELGSSEAGQRARSMFEQTSESGLLDTDTKFEIKKGKADNNRKSGTQYLREIDELGGEAEIPRRVDEVLLQNNRFNSSNPAYRAGDKEGENNSLGSLIIQPQLGQHSPGKFPNKKSGEGSDFTSISIEKLKNFGMMTMLNASGEVNVPPPGDENDYLETLGRNISTAVPGIARLGKRVEVSRFDGVRILNQIEPTFKKELRDATLDGRPVLSYGSVNSVLAPFDGLVGAASINGAAALSLTVTAMVRALYESVQALSASEQDKIQVGVARTSLLDAKKLKLGSSLGKDSFERAFKPYNESSGINLISTKNPYFQCVDKGIEIFFLEQINQNSAGSTINQISKMHGYYNVIFRNLTRNTSDLLMGLVGQFTSEGKSAYDVDPNFGGTDNVITDFVETALGIIKIINNSKILKFMNILALIGEASFAQDDAGYEGPMDSISDVGTLNNLTVPKLGVLHTKSRLSDRFGGRLAWGKSTVKSMYLLPDEVLLAGRRYDALDARFQNFTTKKGFQPAPGGRFSQEQVKVMEKYLEADYMPFYFHDLRTNEISSFHAFLENISDQYSVDYTESEGYGRIGKVYTYKNTNRTVDLSFMVAATNEEDFDDMWIGINKLVTLLYPQYTEGRTLVAGNNSFTQPFSQVIAASPMIRLRLGDILKSNYNKFNLARIFGVGTSNFFLENRRQADEAQANFADRRREIDIIKDVNRSAMIEGRWENGEIAIIAPNQRIRGGGHSEYRKLEIEGNRTRGTRQGRETTDLYLNTPRRVRITNNEARNFRAGAAGVTGFVAFTIINPVNQEENGTFTCDRIYLSPDDDYLEDRASQQVPNNSTGDGQGQQDAQAIRDFFASDGENPNPVFKSFESVRGQGLAGFIKTFNMEIDNKFPWETIGLNNRAPKMVKITMQFLPVHDLQPGLDSNGFNAAPIYNVGKSNRKANSDDAGISFQADDTEYGTNTSIVRSGRNLSGGENT